MELRGREWLRALLVRHDAHRARRAARIRARDRRVRGGDRGAARRGGVSAGARPVPPPEHRRDREFGVSRLRLPLLLALRRAARARLLPALGRRAGYPAGGGGGGGAIEAAAGRALGAWPRPSRSGPL